MTKRFFQKLGLVYSTLVLTGLVVLISLFISYSVTALAGRELNAISLLLALLIPIVIGLTIGFSIIRLVFQLYDTESRLHKLSIHDELTGVYNRRHFITLADREWQRAKGGNGSFAIILFDVDKFKATNDNYGHLAGDEVLKTVSRVCGHACRDADMLARFGGDEFVFLVTDASQEGMLAFLDRVRMLLAEAVVEYGDLSLRFTISMGAANYSAEMPDLWHLLAQADRALYTAKSRGGDCWVIAGDDG
ncbi:GGDEF domain-containing protein [Chloroflexota bacterium]